MNKTYEPNCKSAAGRHTTQKAWLGWLQRRLGGAAKPVALPERDRLQALRDFLAQEFEDSWIGMSGRDRQLYHRLTQSESMDTLRRLRFECFDLMCRQLGEGVARAHQTRIDAWLTSRQ